jgi:hypothetical protein
MRAIALPKRGNGIPDDGFAAAAGGQPNFSHCNRLGMIGISLV